VLLQILRNPILQFTHGGPPIGLSILDFGEPAYINIGLNVWGTRYIHPDEGFISLAYIKQLAGSYAQGFYNRASTATPVPRLILAIGTNNTYDSGHPLTGVK
jgi:hypothetical protein